VLDHRHNTLSTDHHVVGLFLLHSMVPFLPASCSRHCRVSILVAIPGPSAFGNLIASSEAFGNDIPRQFLIFKLPTRMLSRNRGQPAHKTIARQEKAKHCRWLRRTTSSNDVVSSPLLYTVLMACWILKGVLPASALPATCRNIGSVSTRMCVAM
jgi:hypothetical protein